MKIKTSKLEEQIGQASENSLSHILKSVPHTDFVLEMNELLEKKQVIKSDVIKKTTLDRTYTYQMFSGERLPSKDKVIQLALALNCTVQETDRLLSLSNNASLYVKVKRDAIIMFAINENYSVLQTNELLLEHHFDEL